MSVADERGFTIVELLAGMTLSLIVLGATLTTFDGFNGAVRKNNDRNDSAELARTALDAQARQLRNLAKRVSSPVIDTLAASDLIFQTADPNRTWVRYCLDTTKPPASTARARLWTAQLAVSAVTTVSPVTTAMRGACPGSGWTWTGVVADYVTNVRDGLVRPLFTYSCRTGTACATSAASYDEVVAVTAQTYIDTTPGRAPVELRVLSGVHLRNQNQAPVASFAATPSSAARTVVLNAAGSTDYEGRTLDYYWFEQVMPATASINCAQATVTGTDPTRTLWGATGYLGRGISMSYTFPLASGVAGVTRNVSLVVCDPGDRYGTATVAVQIPI
jgi:type II secretory pathway pseudopilin PulG